MKNFRNRYSLLSVVSVAFFMMTSVLFFETESYAETYVAGKHYKVLDVPGKVDDPTKVEVREFFWYGCGHCYKFESFLTPWLKTLPDDVNFVTTPGMAAPSWKLLGSGYYAASKLGVAEESHSALFKAIHADRKPMMKPEQLAAFYKDYGVSEEDFLDKLDSFGVKTSVRKAEQLFRTYGLTGVPAVIVNGKYQPMSRNYAELLRIVDFLIEKERKEMAKNKAQ